MGGIYQANVMIKSELNGVLTARFWNYFPGDNWVKLSLRDGDEFCVQKAGKADEGWYCNTDRFWRDGDVVFHEVCRTMTDCDGRMDRSEQFSCKVEALRSNHPVYEDNAEFRVPAWESLEYVQRDYTAELAGY